MPTIQKVWGDICTLTADASVGYEFTRWSNGATQNPYSFTVEGNATIDGEFSLTILPKTITYTMNVGASAPSGSWITENTDTTRNTYDSTTGVGVLYLNDGVTSIDQYAFKGNRNLLKIDLRDTEITTLAVAISYGVFEDCTNLNEVWLPSTITKLQYCAFYNCQSLTTLHIDATTPPTIATYVFVNHPSDNNLIVPNGCEDVYWDSDWRDYFATINGHTGQFIDYTMSVGSSAPSGTWITNNTDATRNTYNSATGVGRLYLNNGVTSINQYAFKGNANLITINLSKSGLRRLETLTVSGEEFGVFERCTSLTSVVLPRGVTALENYVFSRDESLISITMPESVVSIGKKAFQYCTALQSISLPVTLTTIGEDAFTNCTSLTQVTCNGTIPPTLANNGVFTSHPSNNYLYVPTAAYYWVSGDEYNFGDYFKYINGNTKPNVIGYNMTPSSSQPSGTWITNNTNSSKNVYNSTTGRGVFYLNSTSVTSFDKNAFAQNDNLVKINFKFSSITSFINQSGSNNDGAFFECDGLTNIYLSPSTTTIGTRTFYSCRNLPSISLPSNCRTFGSGAFANCTYLTSLTFPSGTTSIPGYICSGNNRMTSVDIPSSVTSIGSKAFNVTTTASLKTVICRATTPPSLGTDNFQATGDTLKVPSSAVNTYKNNTTWKNAFTTITSI